MSKTPELQKKESAFGYNVELEDAFDVYPKQLLEKVQGQHETLVRAIIDKFEARATPEPRWTYFITRTRHSNPKDSSADYEDPRSETFHAASFASVAVLREFLVKVPAKRSKFVELKLPKGMEDQANPTFAGLHEVRDDEFGWGFDKYGCLVLQSATVEKRRLVREKMYVERKVSETAKIEGDNDCQIIDDNNAGNATKD